MSMEQQTEQQQRFMRFDLPRRLASIASNLIHVVRAAAGGSDTVVLRMLEDAELYLQWTVVDCDPETAKRLVQLSLLVQNWRSIWNNNQHELGMRSEILSQCQFWHGELLKLSGLLVEQ
jgi:hypothetical protein